MNVRPEVRLAGVAAWEGALADVPVAEVLGRLSRENRSGLLTLRDEGRVELSLSNGQLEWAESKEEGSRFVDLLLRKGLIQKGELEEARAASSALSFANFADRLVEKGLISRQVVRAEIAAHSLEVACASIGWTKGEFSFEDRGPAPPGDSAIRTPLSRVIVEGVRRMREDDPFVDRLGDLSLPAGAADLSGIGQSLSLTAEEAYLLSLCDGTIALKDVLRMGPSPSRAAKVVYALMASGLVKRPEPRPVRKPAPLEAEPPEAGPAAFAFDMVIPREEGDEQARLEVARRSYLEARRLIDQKDYYGAIVLLNESVRLCPLNSEYRYRLAGALAKNPRWCDRAVKQYAEAVKLDPIRQELLRDFAEFLAENHRFLEAQTIARRLLDKYPEELRNKLLLARCETGVLESSLDDEETDSTKTASKDPEQAKPDSLLAKFFRRGPKPE